MPAKNSREHLKNGADKKMPQKKRTGETKTVGGQRAAAAPGLSRYQEKEVVIGESREELTTGLKPGKKVVPRIRTVRAKERKRMPFSTVFFMFICTMLVMFMILNFVQINEYTREVSDLKSQVSALAEEKKELNLELEKKNDLDNIEENAKRLGMMGSEELLKVYVNLEKEDKVENYETEEEDYGVVATVMSALGQNLRAYWNIFSGGE